METAFEYIESVPLNTIDDARLALRNLKDVFIQALAAHTCKPTPDTLELAETIEIKKSIPMINIAKWLTEEQWDLYESSKELLDENSSSISADHVDVFIAAQAHVRHLKSLAICKELMKKHEWVHIHNMWMCLECGIEYFTLDMITGMPHKLDCTWAKHIDGFPREVDSDG